ncbi:thiol reductant ABC exporter subunit CydC [Actinoplanes sp. M2I2]|uniref:thiol reductant ABC exporter subunit CydC n=1 Tax=Actinoplanes sp. M2I2 TaxID=1734444 RepID=UPI0020226845|nr:thiol reductant ABC exporter subunit CydC [Actinoplanes sp. M2I2]
MTATATSPSSPGTEAVAPQRSAPPRGPLDPRLVRHARTSRGGIAGLALLGAGQAAATLLVAVALTLLVTRGPGWAAAALAGAYVARAVLSWAEQVVARRTAARVTDELRRSMLAVLPRRGPAWVAAFGAGRLTAVLTTGLDALKPWFSGYLPALVLGVALPPLVIVAMALVDPASAIIALVTLPLIPVLGALIGWATQARARRRWQADARLAGHFLDVVRGLPTLRVFGRADRQTEVIENLTDQHRSATLRVLRVAFLSSTALDLVGTLSVGLIAVEAGLRVAAGDLALGPALFIILLAPEAYRPLREMAARYHASTDATAVISDVDEILTTPPTDTPTAAAPDRNEPGAAGRSAAMPGAAMPGAVVPGAVVPGAVVPGAVVPGAVVPGAVVPGAVVPGAAMPDAVGPDAVGPDAVGPDAVGPDAVGPGVAGPGAVPGFAAPDLTAPAASSAERAGVVAAGVRSRYPGTARDAAALDDLVVRPGEIVALSGPSGAGKTTILRVLAGLQDAYTGVAHATRPLYLPQRPALPHARTIADLFPAGTTDDVIAEALGTVGLTGLTPATPLGERGTGVSAGQRQRLALAALLHQAHGPLLHQANASALRPLACPPTRGGEVDSTFSPPSASGLSTGATFVHNPVDQLDNAQATLLLDEPTAHLDPTTEALVIARLREAARAGCAILVVAHRPALLAAADRIVRLTPPPSERTASITAVDDQRSASATPVDGQRSAAAVDGRRSAAATAVEGQRSATAAETHNLLDTAGATTAPADSHHARPWWRRAGVAVALGSGSSLAGLVLTGAAAWLLVRASFLPPVLTLSTAVVLVRGSAVTRPLLRYLERLVAHDVAFARLGAWRARVFADLIPRVPGPRLRRRGDLLSKVADDVDARVDGLLRGRMPAFVAAVTVVVAGAAAVLLSPAAALPLAAGLLISGILAPALAARQSARDETATGEARARLRDAMVETVDGLEDLATGEGLTDVPRRRSHDLARLEARAARAAGGATALAHLGWGLAVVGVAFALGGLSPEWAAVLLLATVVLGETVLTLPDAAVARQRAAGAETRLAGLTTEPPVATAQPAEGGGGIRLERVTAGWDPAAGPALRELTLDLPAGSRVAVVGRSGSGKSTLAAVVAGLLDPRAGTVSRDAGRVVLVGDDTDHIFASTVRENLRLARPGAGDDDLRAVLARVRLDRWLDGLPDGLDTWLGSGGTTMSGGQARRFATARALLAEPALLILDEPTEGLDADVAGELMADLLDAADGSVLLLAHRPEGLDRVDRVLELSAGRVRPAGSVVPA